MLCEAAVLLCCPTVVVFEFTVFCSPLEASRSRNERAAGKREEDRKVTITPAEMRKHTQIEREREGEREREKCAQKNSLSRKINTMKDARCAFEKHLTTNHQSLKVNERARATISRSESCQLSVSERLQPASC